MLRIELREVQKLTLTGSEWKPHALLGRSGQNVKARADVDAMLPPQYAWHGEWTTVLANGADVALNVATDSQGWSYAAAIGGDREKDASPTRRPSDRVRWRVWRREARRRPGALEPVMSAQLIALVVARDPLATYGDAAAVVAAAAPVAATPAETAEAPVAVESVGVSSSAGADDDAAPVDAAVAQILDGVEWQRGAARGDSAAGFPRRTSTRSHLMSRSASVTAPYDPQTGAPLLAATAAAYSAPWRHGGVDPLVAAVEATTLRDFLGGGAQPAAAAEPEPTPPPPPPPPAAGPAPVASAPTSVAATSPSPVQHAPQPPQSPVGKLNQNASSSQLKTHTKCCALM